MTRNCPWNRCAFCNTYRGQKYSRRSAEEVIRDIKACKAAARDIEAASGDPCRAFPVPSEAHFDAANFLAAGGRTAFLQDADPLAGPPEESSKVLRALRETFPGIQRVTTYCRSRTAARLGAGGFREFKEAGLDRVHTGMESGSDAVLEMVRKGSSAADHVAGGRAVKQAGLELSLYWMPGLGGAALTADHSRASADVVNRVAPDFVRLRSLAVVPGADLFEELAAGRFIRLGEDDVIREIRDFVSRIEVPLRLESDHILNLLEEVRGDFSQDRARVLSILDEYLALPDRERINFRIGRRLGAYRRLRDLHGPLRARVDKSVEKLGVTSLEEADELVWEMMARFV